MSVARWIEANAGTGKTSRLTDEIIRRFREGVLFDRVCAVTFTEKAANEMVERLRAKVVELVLKGLAPPSALDRLNDSFVGTIHAFCNRILRRYGNRLDLPPLFAVDSDNSVFDSLFDTRWDRFVSRQLNTRGDHENFIALFGLQTLRQMAEKLAQRRHDFLPVESGDLEWLIDDLQDMDKWGLQLRGWAPLVLKALEDFPENRDLIEVSIEAVTFDNTAWKNAVLDLIRCKHGPFHSCLAWLKARFVRDLLAEYRALGYLRFDDMILDTREILKNHLDVRREMKERYDLVLVDEMQDTDPVQYEIFLYLCESNERERDFTLREIINGSRKLTLQEGKFFGVGDPKQSIYGFRSADIGAYESVKTMLAGQGVSVEPLIRNFRSCPNLVEFTNLLARRLFPSANPENSEAANSYCAGRNIADCVNLVEIHGEEAGEQHLRVLTEANWLANRVRAMISGPQPRRKPQEIGILLRKLTSAHLYVDALNSRGVRVVIEGERFFYQSQEVIDFLNLLKYIVDEIDDMALAGVLRSPLFSMTDPELAKFFQEYRRDSNAGQALEHAVGHDEERSKTLTGFLRGIAQLRARMQDLTPGALLDEVFSLLPVLTVAGLAYGTSRREIAPLNLLKIHKLALEADAKPEMSAYRFVRTLESYSKEAKQTGQEPMADEAFPAVRIMSIHQSKGLDFPAVFVPLTDYGIGNYEDPSVVKYDWKTDVAGLRINRFTEANYLRLRYGPSELHVVPPLEDPMLAQIQDEERRVLYVAATRAKEEIFFSYVPCAKKNDNSSGRPILDLLAEVLSQRTSEKRPVLSEISEPWLHAEEPAEAGAGISLDQAQQSWKKVQQAGQEFSGLRHISVTEEAADEEEPAAKFEVPLEQTMQARLVGMLCHSVLERIDFKQPEQLGEILALTKMELEGRFAAAELETASSESLRILEAFLQSEAADWLASVEILGREVPVYLFDPQVRKVLSGKVDLLARDNGTLHVIDYKTNVEIDSASRETYARQLDLYARALQPVAAAAPIRKRLCLLRKSAFIDV